MAAVVRALISDRQIKRIKAVLGRLPYVDVAELLIELDDLPWGFFDEDALEPAEEVDVGEALLEDPPPEEEV